MKFGLRFGSSEKMKRFLIMSLLIVSCTGQQAAYPTRIPLITATPVLSAEPENIVSVISDYYKTSRCVVNLANTSLDEWLNQPADKPEFTEFTSKRPPPKAVALAGCAWKARSFCQWLIEQLALHCLSLLFLFLLPLDILAYLFFVQSNGAHTVAACP